MITESDVRWAYKYYLGRAPDDRAAIEYHMAVHGWDRDKLRRAFFNSQEAANQEYFPISTGEWCLWRPGKPKVVIAGNCMGTNLARAAAAQADISVYGFDVLNFPDKEDDLLVYLDEADFIVLPILGEDFGQLESSRARERYGAKIAFYSLPFFKGVHPDLTYLGDRGSRIRSPIGDYHSGVVLRDFLNDVPMQHCLDNFCRTGLNALRPKEIYRTSRDEFLRREANADIRIGDWFFRQIRKTPLLYTINHPTAEVFLEITRRGLRHFGLRCTKPVPSLVQNTLSANVIWPVYRDVAQEVGLRYHSEPLFYADNHAMPLAEFVWRSYELYNRADRDELRAQATERGVP